jgi:ABC-type transport system substrate-binding protein
MQRLLVERSALGPEGGNYECPIAKMLRSDDGLSLTFRLTANQSLDRYDLAQQLLARATESSPQYDAMWAQLASSIAVREPSDVEIGLRSVNVLPEARLMTPLSDSDVNADQPYQKLSSSSGAMRFTINDAYRFRRPSQTAEIVERVMTDPLRALAAIRRGEIDILDRVFPGDIAALKSDESLVVAPYAAPTTHTLVVRSQNPFLASASFRRALLYGANRELLLNEGLLRGASLSGFRVVSSPFPAPVAGMELPTYGYDEQLPPRTFDPRLGMALVLLAEGELKVAFEKQKKTAPKLTPLVLGHPADEMSRVACRGLVKDWKRIGVECKLQEFAPGVFDDASGKCDLVYMQLAAWEPVVDARRLFGPDGLAPSDNEHIQLALRQLDAARNWQEVRQRLLVLHRLLHEDATVLPLWQTVDHFVYRRSMASLSPRRLTLYQDIEQWQVKAALAGGGR